MNCISRQSVGPGRPSIPVLFAGSGLGNLLDLLTKRPRPGTDVVEADGSEQPVDLSIAQRVQLAHEQAATRFRNRRVAEGAAMVGKRLHADGALRSVAPDRRCAPGIEIQFVRTKGGAEIVNVRERCGPDDETLIGSLIVP